MRKIVILNRSVAAALVAVALTWLVPMGAARAQTTVSMGSAGDHWASMLDWTHIGAARQNGVKTGWLSYPSRLTAQSLPRVHPGVLEIEGHYQRQADGAIAAARGFALVATLGTMTPVPRPVPTPRTPRPRTPRVRSPRTAPARAAPVRTPSTAPASAANASRTATSAARAVFNFKAPAARHFAARVGQKTVAKNLNTVVGRGVDIAGDVAAINAGQATRSSANFMINGRTYGVHRGTLHPISGPGFHRLNRGAFKALGILNKFGSSPRAALIMNNMGLHVRDRLSALQVWKALR